MYDGFDTPKPEFEASLGPARALLDYVRSLSGAVDLLTIRPSRP